MYKTIKVAVKGSQLFDKYAQHGHDRQYYSTWKVKVKLDDHSMDIVKILQVDLIDTYATPTKRQLDNAVKLFNNGF